VAVVDHQEAETDADWAVEVDHQLGQEEEDTQRLGAVEDADVVVAAAGDVAVVVAVGDAVAVEDHGAVAAEDPGAVVGLGYKREAADHLLQVAVHEIHLVVAADPLHPEMAAEALSYVAAEVHLFPSVEVHHHLPAEVE
jgi:hypothetical protein